MTNGQSWTCSYFGELKNIQYFHYNCNSIDFFQQLSNCVAVGFNQGRTSLFQHVHLPRGVSGEYGEVERSVSIS